MKSNWKWRNYSWWDCCYWHNSYQMTRKQLNRKPWKVKYTHITDMHIVHWEVDTFFQYSRYTGMYSLFQVVYSVIFRWLWSWKSIFFKFEKKLWIPTYLTKISTCCICHIFLKHPLSDRYISSVSLYDVRISASFSIFLLITFIFELLKIHPPKTPKAMYPYALIHP